MADLLQISDNNLVIQTSGSLSYSRGYAWLKGDKVIFDLSETDAPVDNCRRAPQEMNNRYWQQCEQSSIPPNGAGMRHAADLIWQHLGQLKQKKNLTDLVLVVPSHYRESNLQLLLGIGQACGLNIRGLVNKAVVALQSQIHDDGVFWHFDVQLHQTVCSQVIVSDGLLKLGDIEILNDVGIHLMQEALLKGLQNNFIQNDRFDPLHNAETEQQLFDQLASIATQLAESGKANIGLQHQGRLYNITLDSKEWQVMLQSFTDQLIDVSHSADGSYVDLNAAFGSAGLDSLNEVGVVNLIQAPLPSISQFVQSPDSGSIIYRTDLPTRSNKAGSSARHAVVQSSDAVSVQPPVNSEPSSNVEQATHILSAGKAVRIDLAIISTDDGVLGLSQGSSSNFDALLSSGTLFILNDEGRTQLRVNDRIGSHLVDGVVTAIHVF